MTTDAVLCVSLFGRLELDAVQQHRTEGKISSRQYSEKVKKSVGKSLTTPYRIEGADKAAS